MHLFFLCLERLKVMIMAVGKNHRFITHGNLHLDPEKQ